MSRLAISSVAVAYAIGLLACGSGALAAETVGTVTILEGDASLLRSVSRFNLAEGVRLQGDDLVETGKSTFLRIEFTDGTILDLGPASRAQIDPPPLRRANRPALYLLSGWGKVTAPKSAGGKASFGSPHFDILGLTGVAVTRVDGGAASVFAEDGPVRVLSRRGSSSASFTLRTGDFLDLKPDAPARVEGRPVASFVSALPRAFQDTIPPRPPHREVAAKPAGTFNYADVEPWIDSEAVVRRRFVRDWVAKIDDPQFRDRLEGGLSRHPEWDPILHPPPPPPPPEVQAAAPGGPASTQAAAAAVPAPLVPAKDAPASPPSH